MTIRLSAFVRNYARVTNNNFTGVKFVSLSELIMPYMTCMHFIDMDPSVYGVRGSHPFLVNYKGTVKVWHDTNPELYRGRAIRNKVNYVAIQKAYFGQQTKLSRVRSLDKAIESKRNVLVYDYSLLPMAYNYSKYKMATYDQWYNIRSSLIKGVNIVGDRRVNLIQVNMPRFIPSLAEFNKVDTEIDTRQASIFNSFEALDLREIWLYLEGKGTLSRIPRNTAMNTVILFVDGAISATLRLSDIAPEKDDKGQPIVDSKTAQIKMNFVKFLNKFIDQREDNEGGYEEDINLLDETTDEALTKAPVQENPVIDDVRLEINKPEQVPDTIKEAIIKKADAGRMSPDGIKKFIRLTEESYEAPNPLGEGTIKELLDKPDEIVIDEKLNTNIKIINDPSMLNSTISNWDKHYVKKQLKKDIVDTIMSFSKAGVVVSDFKREEVFDAQNDFSIYKARLNPINGSPSVLTLKIPNITEDGTYTVGGTTYTIGNQRVDAPIRKTKPDEVALTSYYGKTFVSRHSSISKNYQKWVVKNLTKTILDTNNAYGISKVMLNSQPKIKAKVPLIYSGIARSITSFKHDGFTYHFSYANRKELFTPEVINKFEKNGDIVVAVKGEEVIVLNDLNEFVSSTRGNIGRIEKLMFLNKKAPKDFSSINVLGKEIPLIVFISYVYGFEKALKRLGIKYRLEPNNVRTALADNELMLKFSDTNVIITVDTLEKSMLVYGWDSLSNTLKSQRFAYFNKEGGYVTLFETLKINSYHLNEIGQMKDMFIDNMTKRLLIQINEPTDFIKLLLRSNKLLLTDESPDEVSLEHQVIRGLERINGIIYRKMVEAIRQQRNNVQGDRAGISVNPHNVFMDILSDTATKLTNPINPIELLKEEETVSLSGFGGRDAVSLVKRSRVYSKSDLGTISEATPDSAKTGIRVFTSPNPKMNNSTGITERHNAKTDTAVNILSTTANLMPGSSHDD